MNMLALMIACSGAVAAEDVWQPREANPVWQSECGSCHMAFPPALLSKSDWHLMMQGLDKHFGVNASLDTKSSDEITAFLERNAGSSWGGHSADSQRITETSWFVKRHKSSIRMFMRGQVKSLADCMACHKEEGTERVEQGGR
jgi:Dihaem cytochrome c